MDFFFFGRMLHNDGALETTMGRTAPQRLFRIAGHFRLEKCGVTAVEQFFMY